MKAAIYNPYLDTLGGGERYSISFAKVLAKSGYEVDVQWKKESIRGELEKRFGFDLKEINFKKDIKRGDKYDICFWVSDGSIPLLRARRNFLHFQIPFKDINGRSLLNKMKLYRIDKVICNSYFTKKFIDEEYGINSIVIYPPVDTISIKPIKKENIILSVSRFSQLTQSKRQDILISVFKRLIKKGLRGWKLILAGGTEVGADEYFKKLKKSIIGYPIEIIENPLFKSIVTLYGRAKFFWSASGFGIDENKDPKKVEHFGITTVEAMAAGCIPFIYNAGGSKEIIKYGVNGYLWSKENDLVKVFSKTLIDKSLINKLSTQSIATSKKYGYEKFEQEIRNLL